MKRQIGIATGRAGLSLLVASCGVLSGDTYSGGVVIDPAGVALHVTQELVADDGGQVGGLGLDGLHTTVDQRTVTLSGRAEICSNPPDVVLDVDGETLKVQLVMPPAGVPCSEGENYLVTIKLERDFDEYELRG